MIELLGAVGGIFCGLMDVSSLQPDRLPVPDPSDALLHGFGRSHLQAVESRPPQDADTPAGHGTGGHDRRSLHCLSGCSMSVCVCVCLYVCLSYTLIATECRSLLVDVEFFGSISKQLFTQKNFIICLKEKSFDQVAKTPQTWIRGSKLQGGHNAEYITTVTCEAAYHAEDAVRTTQLTQAISVTLTMKI